MKNKKGMDIPMKKMLAGLLMLVFIVGLTGMVAAEDGNTYDCKEAEMSITLPSNWIVLQRDMSKNADAIAALGTTQEAVQQLFDGQPATALSAINPDEMMEITIVVTPRKGTNNVSFKACNEKERERAVKNMSDMREWDKNEISGEIQYVEVRESELNCFAMFDAAISTARYGDYYTYQAMTFLNRKDISISLRTYEEKATSEQQTVLNDVVDSVVFDRIEKSSGNMQGIVGWFTILLIVIAGIALIQRRNRKKQNLQPITARLRK